jgi:hypothetical protein
MYDFLRLAGQASYNKSDEVSGIQVDEPRCNGHLPKCVFLAFENAV